MDNKTKSEYKIINAESIVEPANPHRVEMDQDALAELADSIRTIGLKEPLIVRPVGDKFEIVAGHRRFKACLLAQVINIPCLVETLTDDEAEDVKAHENLFRADLSPLEDAMALRRLILPDGSNLREIAMRRGKSQQWVEERLGILNYPEYFWPAIEAGQIGLGVAKCLAGIEDEGYRKMFFDQAVRDGMKLYQAEYLFEQWRNGVFTPSEILSKPLPESGPGSVPKFKTPCAACGLVAEEPNLTNVFVHKTCPKDAIADATIIP